MADQRQTRDMRMLFEMRMKFADIIEDSASTHDIEHTLKVNALMRQVETIISNFENRNHELQVELESLALCVDKQLIGCMVGRTVGRSECKLIVFVIVEHGTELWNPIPA